MDEEKARRIYEGQRIEDLTKKVDKLRILCRENTRELLQTKKRTQVNEKRLIEEKTKLVDEINGIRGRLMEENKRNENAEKVRCCLSGA